MAVSDIVLASTLEGYVFALGQIGAPTVVARQIGTNIATSVTQSSLRTTSCHCDQDFGIAFSEGTSPASSASRESADNLSSVINSSSPSSARGQHPLVRSESAPLKIFSSHLGAFHTSLVLQEKKPFDQSVELSFPKSSRPAPIFGMPLYSRSMSSTELARTSGVMRALKVSSVAEGCETDPERDNEGCIPTRTAACKDPSLLSSEKSVFDMIQDDFPRTPAPILSSFQYNTCIEDGSVYKEKMTDSRRSRWASTAFLDLDYGHMGTEIGVTWGLSPQKDARDSSQSGLPSRSHRRSVSINWTGDLGTKHCAEQYGAIAKRSSRSTTDSAPAKISSNERNYTGLRGSTVSGSATMTSVEENGSNGEPTEKHSPSKNAFPECGIGPHPEPGRKDINCELDKYEPEREVHSSRPVPTAGIPVVAHESRRNFTVDEFSRRKINGYQCGANCRSGRVGSMRIDALEPGSRSQYMLPDHVNGMAGDNFQDMGNASHYESSFFGASSLLSPFSNSTPGIGNGVDHMYSDVFHEQSFSDATDNIKSMSVQMAAFISAQQQLYAAHMAHAAAVARNPSVSGLSLLSGLHRRLNQTANAVAGGPIRSPWESGSTDYARPSFRGASNSRNVTERYRPGVSSMRNRRNGSTDAVNRNRPLRYRRGVRTSETGGFASVSKGDRLAQYTTLQSGTGAHHMRHRSPLLEEFRATSVSIGRSSSPPNELAIVYGSMPTVVSPSREFREWHLSEIVNDISDFATDQHGSRFIQQKLDSASREEKSAVLKSALDDAQLLMMDVFGNYVVQKLLEHGGDTSVNLIAKELTGRMLHLSLHMYGCRVVQKALEVLEPSCRSDLVRELDGHVVQCIRDQNGNHVIQKCVELVEYDTMQFIVDSVVGQAVALAGHSYGCRVVQRVLEHGASHQKRPIMLEIMTSVKDLIKDQYGNYVIQHVVEHGTAEERAVIVTLVQGEITELSQHKFASNVVERCLQFGILQERETLIEILIGDSTVPSCSPLNHLVRDQFGNYVVQRVLDVALSPQRDRVVTILRSQVPAIKRYSYGKHIIARLESHQLGARNLKYGSRPVSANGDHGATPHLEVSQISSEGRSDTLSLTPNLYSFYE